MQREKMKKMKINLVNFNWTSLAVCWRRYHNKEIHISKNIWLQNFNQLWLKASFSIDNSYVFFYFQALWFDFILPTTETVPDVSGSLDIEGKIVLLSNFVLFKLCLPPFCLYMSHNCAKCQKFMKFYWWILNEFKE